ncbi:hypothetical protein [Paenibacillus segetis]|uniref:Uncharacterized protein n=1 Tax=Paenibacillus segetis TaxID=1325360 RepID=A0ABQ1YBQ3_9BACL|nr:hypothetical protein [Paenibacillus segetis]GGH18810.1 hypothetical protein GCM10008013_15040 [Paenibacillus segetis]
MLDKENKISIILAWIGIIYIVVGFILGLVLGKDSDGYEQVWSLTFIWWVGGLISGMFFIGLSEIIEQLHRINMKLRKEPVNDDDLILLND